MATETKIIGNRLHISHSGTLGHVYELKRDSKGQIVRDESGEPIQDGEAIAYYDNGRVRSRFRMKDGKAHGVSIDYDQAGRPCYEANFEDGVCIRSRDL